MKKSLLIMMASVICFITTGVQSVANAKMMTPFYYDSNFASDSTSVAQKFRYADAILIKNVDDYIKLLNIQSDPTYTQTDAYKIINEISAYCTNESNPSISFTNKAMSSLVYIVFYQEKYGGQLSRQISLFTDSQKKQYWAILYNIKMSAHLYNSAYRELENSISDNPYDFRLAKMTPVIGGLNFAERIADKISSNMALSSSSHTSDVNNPSTQDNVPKTSSTLYNHEQPIVITLGVVNSREQDARNQYSNVLASANSSSPNDDQFFEWETKGLEYLQVEKNYAKALEYFTKAINLKPSKGEAWAFRGSIKYRLADYSGSIYDYTKAISLGYDIPMSYFCRARSKLVLGQYNSAAEDFKKVYLVTRNTKGEDFGGISLGYYQEIQNGNGAFVKTWLSDPYELLKEPIKQMIASSMRIDSDSKPTTPYQVPTKPQQKSVCPVGSRVYMIIGRLKGSHTEVRFTTIAPINKIEDLVNADPRFEWVRYESVPDDYLDRYPRY